MEGGAPVKKPMNQKCPAVEPGIHLNLGCGMKIWPGFINVDFPDNWSGKKPEIECDLHTLPFPDNYADSAYAIHVLEHFMRREAEDVLREWIRVLKPGGRLVIEVPCLDRVLMLFNHFIQRNEPIDVQLTMWRLYGNPAYKDRHMTHCWCYSVSELVMIFHNVGLTSVEVSEPEFHSVVADMRVTGVKK